MRSHSAFNRGFDNLKERGSPDVPNRIADCADDHLGTVRRRSPTPQVRCARTHLLFGAGKLRQGWLCSACGTGNAGPSACGTASLPGETVYPIFVLLLHPPNQLPQRHLLFTTIIGTPDCC
jgi:hypothetical protein